MKAQTRFAFIGLIVLIALLTSIALPITAMADEAPTPPPASDSSGAAQPAQGAQPADTSAPAMVDTSAPAQPADMSAPTEPPPAVDTSAPAATQDAVVTDIPAPADTTTDTNSPAATDTPVVVLNSDGTVEPLATQAAADIIATGDPMWCPGNNGTPTIGGCIKGATVTKLISKLGSSTGPGIVYFETTYSNKDATFDHTNSNLTGLTALTIQGGWNGDSSAAGFSYSGVSNFSVPLSVINWTDDVTIKDITISGTNSDGLTVTTAGDIKVKDVSSSNNHGNGAYLDNSKDAGNITIKGSSNNFSDNQHNGLEIYSNGYVTLNNVIADGNKYDGALLGGAPYSDYSAIGGTVDVTDSDFSINKGHGLSNNPAGLETYAYGTITLTKVTANENNNADGAYLDNCLYNGGICTGSGSIEVDRSTFGDSPSTGNEYNGLEVYSNGYVSLNKVTADGNKYDGALLGGNSDSDQPAIGGTISVTGNSEFNHNKGNGTVNPAGLEAYAYGTITLTDVKANHNSGDGAYLVGYGTLTLTDVTANNNYIDGADLESYYGSILVDGNSTFNNNGQCGADCLTQQDGLEVYSNGGDITLDGVDASWNYNDGAYLQAASYLCGFDDNGPIFCKSGNIFVKDNSTFNRNGFNGLRANTDGGDISLENVTAGYKDSDGNIYGNYVNGAYLEAYSYQCGFDSGGGAIVCSGGYVSVTSSIFDANGICLNCESLMNGLTALTSGGYISLDYVDASWNYNDGAFLDNRDGTGYLEVDNSTFNGNGTCGGDCGFFTPTDGLDVYSSGNILLTHVTANDNYFYGAYLDNTEGNGSIEVDNSTFGDSSGENGNGNNGLEAYSNGGITLNNTDAFGNYGDGATVGTEGVVIVSCGHYDNNSGAGINDTESASLHLNNPELSGNGNGPYAYAGTAVIGIDCGGTPASSGSAGSSGGGSHNASGNIIPVTGLPIHTINVSGGEGNGLDCTQYGGTQLILPNNNSALFPCPISDSASLGASSSDKLPGTLPGGNTFVSGVTTSVIKNGASSSPVNGSISVSFTVPDNMKDSKLAILYWDGGKWVEVPGHMTPDGHFESQTNLTGTFVLVSK